MRVRYEELAGHERRNSWPHSTSPERGHTIVHIALQGCLKSGDIDYGITEDTGGHIRYLADLVAALEGHPSVRRQLIVTRRFTDGDVGPEYARYTERWSDRCELWRLDGHTGQYLAKEQLAPEIPTLAKNLLRRLVDEGIVPTLVHAHYADAGVVAAYLKRWLNTPVAFTGHSLGAVKRTALLEFGDVGPELTAILDRREALEERAIAAADYLIASSRDERDTQYGYYHSAARTPISVNPPGCDLAAFSSTQGASEEVRALFAPFLKDPDKPALFVLARPVHKKNLIGALRAYATHPDLRGLANLVIVGGTRMGITGLEPEARAVWNDLLRTIDDYDLYGSVAYPKSHRPQDVSAMYAWIRERRGILVNLAYNEPFGLTLLEAAAAGVPVVATCNGGPVDILQQCRHGILVDPRDLPAVHLAFERLLTDPAYWDRCQREGVSRVKYYQWARHADQYIADLEFHLRESDVPVPPGAASICRAPAVGASGPASGVTVSADSMDYDPARQAGAGGVGWRCGWQREAVDVT